MRGTRALRKRLFRLGDACIVSITSPSSAFLQSHLIVRYRKSTAPVLPDTRLNTAHSLVLRLKHAKTPHTGRVFLSREASAFSHVLEYLRNGSALPPSVPIPTEESELERIRAEFDYFLLPEPFPAKSRVEKLRRGEYTASIPRLSDKLHSESGDESDEEASGDEGTDEVISDRDGRARTLAVSCDGTHLAYGNNCTVNGQERVVIEVWDIDKMDDTPGRVVACFERGDEYWNMAFSSSNPHELLWFSYSTWPL